MSQESPVAKKKHGLGGTWLDSDTNNDLAICQTVEGVEREK